MRILIFTFLCLFPLIRVATVDARGDTFLVFTDVLLIGGQVYNLFLYMQRSFREKILARIKLTT